MKQGKDYRSRSRSRRLFSFFFLFGIFYFYRSNGLSLTSSIVSRNCLYSFLSFSPSSPFKQHSAGCIRKNVYENEKKVKRINIFHVHLDNEKFAGKIRQSWQGKRVGFSRFTSLSFSVTPFCEEDKHGNSNRYRYTTREKYSKIWVNGKTPEKEMDKDVTEEGKYKEEEEEAVKVKEFILSKEDLKVVVERMIVEQQEKEGPKIDNDDSLPKNNFKEIKNNNNNVSNSSFRSALSFDDTNADVVADAIPLPKALYYLFPNKFPTLSKARKWIRAGGVLLETKTKTKTKINYNHNSRPYNDGSQLSNNNNDNNQNDHNDKQILTRCDTTISEEDKILILPKSMHMKKQGKKVGNRNEKIVPVIFEDDHIAVINKPRGLAVHGKGEYSLLHKLPSLLQPTRVHEKEALARPVHVHRLDAPTGGLLLIAKTKSALVKLTEAFKERRVDKEYLALAVGSLDSKSSLFSEKTSLSDLKSLVDETVLTYKDDKFEEDKEEDGEDEDEDEHETNDKKQSLLFQREILEEEVQKTLLKYPNFRVIDSADANGKFSLSLFQTLSITKSHDYGHLSTIRLKPITGRQHQLRQHLASLNHPILGDVRYGDGKNQITSRGLFLFSKEITFLHPVTNETLHFSLEEPEIFGNQRNMERKREEKRLLSEEDRNVKEADEK